MTIVSGYLTTDQAAELLGVDRRSVHRYLRAYADFPTPARIGRTLLYAEAELRAWRSAHPARKPRGDAKESA
jgi:prophage regulatory protein